MSPRPAIVPGPAQASSGISYNSTPSDFLFKRGAVDDSDLGARFNLKSPQHGELQPTVEPETLSQPRRQTPESACKDGESPITTPSTPPDFSQLPTTRTSHPATSHIRAVSESFLEGKVKTPQRPSKPKTVRRHPAYVVLDVALREAADAQPKDQEEVIRILDNRAKIPNAQPFKSAGGWLKGFQKDPRAARVWLSKHWSRLGLKPFMRGPK